MLIVRDKNTGQCFHFNTDRSGYEKARECIRSILEQGHEVDSPDLDRISQFFNGNLF